MCPDVPESLTFAKSPAESRLGYIRRRLGLWWWHNEILCSSISTDSASHVYQTGGTPKFHFSAPRGVDSLVTSFSNQMQQKTDLEWCASLDPCDDQEHLEIVVSAFRLKRLPRKFIAVQLEPLTESSLATRKYLGQLAGAQLVLDYSQRNITLLSNFGIPSEKLRRICICPTPQPEGKRILAFEERDIDVLFFGWMASERRRRAIAHLSQSLSLQIVEETFGGAMDDLIGRAKVVVNIHYYEESPLEQVRIAQCLQQGTPVVSEASWDSKKFIHASSVDFVPRGDWEGMAEAAKSLVESRAAWATKSSESLTSAYFCKDSIVSVLTRSYLT